MAQFQEVKSSYLKAVAYDEDSELLKVKFKKGTVFSYHGVQKETFDNLMLAPSVGAFFAHEIRGAYPFKKEEA